VDKAYRNVEKIHFDGMHYRRDIAERGWKLIT
jgi:phosphoribosylamine-glycine ligase